MILPGDAAGARIDQALARLLPEHSRSRLCDWLRAGHIRVDGECVQPKQKVRGGEIVTVTAPADPKSLPAAAEAIALDIRYEDREILVLDKPVGLVVHPGSGNWSGTLLNALLHHCGALAALPRAGIVHRLDKDTSGLMVVAKTLTAQTHLVRELARRSVARVYAAIARGRFMQDQQIDAPIGRHPTERTRMAVIAHGRPARTHVRVVERFAQASLLECRLDTGRTHQIRVHLASLGHPLIGDRTYCGRRAETDALLRGFPRQALHARLLELDHPASGLRMRWVSELPADMAALLAALRATQNR